jgi:hypothetical protein
MDPGPTPMDPTFPKSFCTTTSFVDPPLYLALRFAPGFAAPFSILYDAFVVIAATIGTTKRA